MGRHVGSEGSRQRVEMDSVQTGVPGPNDIFQVEHDRVELPSHTDIQR